MLTHNTSELKRMYDIYRHPADSYKYPQAISREKAQITCFCQLSAYTLRDAFDIFETQMRWWKRGWAEWGTVGGLYSKINAGFPWIFSEIYNSSKTADMLLKETLLIPLSIKPSQFGNEDNKYISYIAKACWYVLLDYRAAGLFKSTIEGPLREIINSEKLDGGLLKNVINPKLSVEDKETQWGISTMIMLLFRIFSELELEFKNVDILFQLDDINENEITNLCYKIWNCKDDNFLLRYSEFSGIKIIMPPFDLKEKRIYCQKNLIILFCAYIYYMSFLLITKHGLNPSDYFDNKAKLENHSDKKVLAHLFNKLNNYLDEFGKLENKIFEDIDSGTKCIRTYDNNIRRTIILLLLLLARLPDSKPFAENFYNKNACFNMLKIKVNQMEEMITGLSNINIDNISKVQKHLFVSIVKRKLQAVDNYINTIAISREWINEITNLYRTDSENISSSTAQRNSI